jgi:hypothetical protein
VLSLLELQKRPVPSTLNKATLEARAREKRFSLLRKTDRPTDRLIGATLWLGGTAAQVYLSDDEFSSALGMPRDQFYSLRHATRPPPPRKELLLIDRSSRCCCCCCCCCRAWKQTQVKKKAGLL